MAWTPVKLSSTKRQKGWRPEKGWYCVDETTKQADLGSHYVKKAEARKACKAKGQPIAQVADAEKKP